MKLNLWEKYIDAADAGDKDAREIVALIKIADDARELIKVMRGSQVEFRVAEAAVNLATSLEAFRVEEC